MGAGVLEGRVDVDEDEDDDEDDDVEVELEVELEDCDVVVEEEEGLVLVDPRDGFVVLLVFVVAGPHDLLDDTMSEPGTGSFRSRIGVSEGTLVNVNV